MAPTAVDRPWREPRSRRGWALAFAAFAWWSCLAPLCAARAVEAGPPASVTRVRWLMGTLWTMSAPAAAQDAGRTGGALDAALDTVAALERSLSNWRATSELSLLNAAGRAAVSEPLFAVLDSSLALASESGGAFDPTVESLTLAWDLRGRGRVPSAAALAAARKAVGWQSVQLLPATAAPELAGGSKRGVALNGTRIDLGGVGKGFALDRAAAVLAARGVSGGVLDAGGQRLLTGAGPCSVWVAHPLHREEPAVLLVLGSGSLSTSAQSEHLLRARGLRIGHILDPRTGRPVASHASVSVFARSGTRADALSTALLVMGRERARTFADNHSEIGVLWLEPRGSRVLAHCWNLEVAAAAPFVTLAPSDRNPKLARIP